ncbi:MAG: DUF11 domain-containing protein [Acidobacteriota bacterium]|jgi:uncharacterized repeat protein (TIGR01451 family)
MHTKKTVGLALLGAAALVLGTGVAFALGTSAGTVISNQATVDYEDANGNTLQELSNVVQTTVAQVAAVDVAPDNSSSATPGDVIYYAHVVTNNGNGDDTIDLTAASSLGWAVQIYADVDGDGLYNGAVDTLLTDSDGDTVPDTGTLAENGTFRLLIEVTVPGNAADGASDTTTVTGTSTFDTLVSESALDTTTIQAPTLSVVKSVSPTGDQPPGTTLTYTVVITNNGTADAQNVVLTDPAPASTTYSPGTITVGGASRTDTNGDADGVDFGFTTSNAVTVQVGTLAAGGGSVTITFDVVID